MSFDVAVGMSDSQLNTASQSVYTALYPKVFTGSQPVTYQGLQFNVAWNVQAAPQFDLTPSTDATPLARALRQRAAGEGRDISDLDAILPQVAAAYPSFDVTFPTVALTFSNGASTKLTLALTAQCYLEVNGTTISFVPYQVTAPQQSDPVTNWLVQNVVVPAIQSMAKTLLLGITIPPISVAGVSLSTPAVGIVDNAVIAAVNLASSGTPAPPDGSTPWPGAPFFALLGPNLVQALTEQAMASASNRFSDSGHGGDSWAGYKWSYALNLANPQTAIQGTLIAMKFQLSGSVSGGVKVVYVPLDLSFNANAEPNPSISAGVAIVGSSVDLVTQQVNPFTVIVTPGSSVPDWVLGWLISAIIDGVVSSVTPLITQFLGGIKIDSFDIPTYTISVSGTQLTLTPANLQTTNVAGYLAVAGDITITG